jgi:hypothetical protein
MSIDDGSNACSLHARAGAAEELQIRAAAAERVHQASRVEVTGCFAGRDKNFRGHYILV